jgi:hypothetical protein
MLTAKATPIGSVDRQTVLHRYRLNRRRSKELFDLVAPGSYTTNPIPLRHVIAFYEGHLPVFSFNTLIKRALGQPGIDEGYEKLFARGIDPEDEAAARAAGQSAWPSRSEILAYAAEADRRILAALEGEELDRPGHPLLDRAEAVFTILEHDKIEVADAIPYNGAIMHNANVVVSYNSDSNELARRLNSEAGKAVKYGGVAEEEALKFVTWNPAKQLHVENRVGSIEPGKDADLALWNASPLSYAAVCEQTWVDGRKYFDRDEDRRMREQTETMRSVLIQKALRLADRDEGKGPGDRRPPVPRVDEYDEHSSSDEGGSQ